MKPREKRFYFPIKLDSFFTQNNYEMRLILFNEEKKLHKDDTSETYDMRLWLVINYSID